jgi:hypothetical protein
MNRIGMRPIHLGEILSVDFLKPTGVGKFLAPLRPYVISSVAGELGPKKSGP